MIEVQQYNKNVYTKKRHAYINIIVENSRHRFNLSDLPWLLDSDLYLHIVHDLSGVNVHGVLIETFLPL